MTHVLVIGEALVDVIRRRDAAEQRHPGGSPANVAYGLGRLDRPVRLLTRLGDDADGELLRTHLASVGVETDAGPEPLARTSTAIAVIGDDGSATYTFDLEWALTGDTALGEPLAVHTGSLGSLLDPGAAAVERLVHSARARSTISYDPNIRPMLMGSVDQTRTRVERFVALSDVVKASQEDIEWLTPGVPPLETVQRWLELGPAFVVVTMGGNGSIAMARGCRHRPAGAPSHRGRHGRSR